MVLLSIRILEIFFFISYCYKQSSNFINRFPSKNCFYLFVLYFDLTMFQLCTSEITIQAYFEGKKYLKITKFHINVETERDIEFSNLEKLLDTYPLSPGLM